MPVFSVSFRIHRDATYQHRYDTFVEQLTSVGVGNYWDETTSYMLVRTHETIGDFCTRIYVHSGFDSSKDVYVVMDVDAKSARARGKIEYPNTLKSLVPYIVPL